MNPRRRSRSARSIDDREANQGRKNESVDRRFETVFSQLASIKKTVRVSRSLLSYLPVPRFAQNYGFVLRAILSFFLSLFRFAFVLSRDHSLLILPLPLSSRGSRERRSIINDMRHTGSRNIKYSRAFMTAPVGKRGRRGPDRWGPRDPVGGKKSRRTRAGGGRKGERAKEAGVPPRRRIYRGEIRRFIEAVRGS